MIRDHVKELKNVEVDCFDGMLVDYLKNSRQILYCAVIRTVSDFEYEFQRALTNRALNKEVETVFVMTSEQYSFLEFNINPGSCEPGRSV